MSAADEVTTQQKSAPAPGLFDALGLPEHALPDPGEASAPVKQKRASKRAKQASAEINPVAGTASLRKELADIVDTLESLRKKCTS